MVNLATTLLTYLDCLEMLVEVVSVVLRAPIDSASEDIRDLSIRVLTGRKEKKEGNALKNL